VQLPCSGHLAHPISTDARSSTDAGSLTFSRTDYHNALLQGTLTSTIEKLQQVQNNTAQTVLQASRWSDAKLLLCSLHQLLMANRTVQKMETVAFKVQHTATSAYPTGTYRPTNACTTYWRWQLTLVVNFLRKPMLGFSSSACCKLVQLCILLGRTKTSHITLITIVTAATYDFDSSIEIWNSWSQILTCRLPPSECAYSWSFYEFFSIATVNISFCEWITGHQHQYMSMILAIVLCKWVLHCSSLYSICELYDFWTKIFHKVKLWWDP